MRARSATSVANLAIASKNGYEQFGFNSLRKYPIIDVGNQRYIAVDPELIVKRVSHGIYYDMLGHVGMDFTTRFGDVFDCFIGEILESVIDANLLWSATTRRV